MLPGDLLLHAFEILKNALISSLYKECGKFPPAPRMGAGSQVAHLYLHSAEQNYLITLKKKNLFSYIS